MNKLTYRRGPLPRSFPISCDCKLDTGIHSQKCTLNSKCKKCCKWTCCSVMPIRHHLSQPGMVLLPRWTNLSKDSSNQPHTKIYKTAAKMYVMTKIPRQHTWRAIKPQFNNIYWPEIKEIEWAYWKFIFFGMGFKS